MQEQRRAATAAGGLLGDVGSGDHPIGLGEDSGPSPLVRAFAGLFVGLAAGALAAALTPRPARAARTAPVGDGRRLG